MILDQHFYLIHQQICIIKNNHMKGLRTSLEKVVQDRVSSLALHHINTKRVNMRFASAFLLASLASGINWYFQSAIARN